MSSIELPNAVTPDSVEWVYRRALSMQRDGNLSYMEQGFRAAQARDPKLLAVLEKGSEVLCEMQEHQLGRTQRAVNATVAERADQTPFAIWRECYKLADEGRAIDNFAWLYAAAGEFAGVVIP
jgi:hypothetical protein